MQNKIVTVPDGRRGKHLTIGPYAENNDRGDDDYQICEDDKRESNSVSS